MKRSLLKKAAVLACASLALTVTAQEVSRETMIESLKQTSVSKMQLKKQVKNDFTSVSTRMNNVNTLADEVKYNTPKGISSILELESMQGFVTFLSFNRIENDRTENSFNYLIAPKDSLVGYYNVSTKSGNSSWAIPGGDPATSTDRDIIVSYPKIGAYDFPTLSVSGTDFTAPGKIVSGGKGEIALFDFMTAKVGSLKYTNNGGWPTGSSANELEGLGQIYYLFKEAEISKVNVYIAANPTAKDPNNKIKMTIWAPDFSGSEPVLEGRELGSAELKVSEMMADATDVTGLKGSGGKAFAGMASFELATPVKVTDFFFISITNYGNDVENGDSFVVLQDFETPMYGDPNLFFNWCSYIKGAATDGSIRWFSMYPSLFEEGASSNFTNGNTNLLICPVINYDVNGTGISNVAGEVKNQAFASDGTLSLSSDASNEVEIYTVSGQLIQSVSLNDGNQTISTTGWAKGVYVVKFANGENVKVIL